MKRPSFVLLIIFIITIAFGGSGCGKAYSVFGRVADELDQGIANVTITFSGGYSGTTTTNADGNWSKNGINGVVLVTPTKEGWVFDPTNRTVTKTVSGIDFLIIPEPDEERHEEIIEQGHVISALFSEDTPSEISIEQALEILNADPKIKTAGASETGDAVWWITYDGIPCGAGHIHTEESAAPQQKIIVTPRQNVNSASSTFAETSSTYVGNRKIIGLSCFKEDFEPFDEVNNILDTFDLLGYSYDDYDYFENEECTVDTFKTIGDYGVVLISSHGSTDYDSDEGVEQVLIWTGDKVTAQKSKSYNEDLLSGRLIKWFGVDTYAITPKFIEYYCKKMPNSIVYASSCLSAYNDTMANAFTSEEVGAGVYYGYNVSIYPLLAQLAGTSLFNNLLLGFDSGTAYDLVFLMHSIFKMYGAEDILLADEPSDEITITLPGGVPLTMALIPAGTFMMGSLSSDSDRSIIEEPQHQVTITKPFYMGTYEVTQEQWEAVMENNPSWFNYNPKNPVECVSWNDCQDFIMELNTMGIGKFRLPTEAEWEYACRAGSTTRFPWGHDPEYSQLGQYAWYRDNSGDKTHPVGQKQPNAWGLSDMHGNVYEWCSDWFGDYSSASQTDPTGPSSGDCRILRGGDWYLDPQFCRSANRSGSTPTGAYNFLGFRLVREL